MIVHERTLRNVLTPAYHWLFVIMGRLRHGVKFLVDLRTDVLVSRLKELFFRLRVSVRNNIMRHYGSCFFLGINARSERC